MSTNVYHGPWINWSHGNFFTGATLTVSDRHGALLTSFIATFVALVGTQLWKILAFTIHQIRSTNRPQDGLFHQQQVVWRNTATPGGAAWTLAQQVWFWRSKANWSFLRTFTWAVFATSYLIIFALAAVFSSEISKTAGTQRLMVQGNCGYWFRGTSANNLTILKQRLTTQSLQAASYAKACYGGNYNPLQCSQLPVPSLKYDINANATCPFAKGMCIYGGTAAYQMTSKLIDSQHDLGINTQDRDKVQFQKVTTCAPIVQVGYVNRTNIHMDLNAPTPVNDTYWFMRYGSIGVIRNYTEVINTHVDWDYQPYKLTAYSAVANTTKGNGWIPISNLFRTDADAVIMFLQPNSMRFAAPVYDPWFVATELDSTSGMYLGNLYAYTMACAEQYRYCNPNNNQCSPYMGAEQLIDSLGPDGTTIQDLSLSTMQSLVAERMGYAAIFTSVWNIVDPRGANALQAQETVSGLEQAALPNNHWHLEMSTWFDASLANFQRIITEYASESLGSIPGARVILVDNCTECQYLCRNQLINDTGATTSFNILGMTILFVIGGIILVTSLIIDRVIGLLQSWLNFNLVGKRAWMLDDKLHIQRNMFEQTGMGRWHEADDVAVPVTISKEKFSRFPAHEPFGPNSPDTPPDQEGFTQKTEYSGAGGKAPGVYMTQ